jgi:UDP:flavonoid glycosyltransferase YjiC (YdhE family)
MKKFCLRASNRRVEPRDRNSVVRAKMAYLYNIQGFKFRSLHPFSKLLYCVIVQNPCLEFSTHLVNKSLKGPKYSNTGMLPIREADMLQTVQDKESEATKVRLYQLKRMAKGAGVLVNTFDWLEPTALKALHDGVCAPGRPTPRVYCIEPLVNGGSRGDSGGERHECLAWLDAQPKRSVVFLCFGSMGAFSAAQLQEIARGLESSGHRFLWAVSPREEQSQFPEPDLERLLPAGFMERASGWGMVVKNWAPQSEVVEHEAIAAFVTHSGWNSTLEAIMAMLPMICWPLYAEQSMNKAFLVEEMEIAVEMEGYGEFVKAEEVEAKVRLVMDTEEGKMLRERLAVTKEKALEAIKEGGSSKEAFAKFIRDLGQTSSS